MISTRHKPKFNFCPGKFVYDINDFSYDNKQRVLYGKESCLLPVRCHLYNSTTPLPNNGRKFYIANSITKNFRRFILERETDKYYYFKFEDLDNDSHKTETLYCTIRKQQIKLIRKPIKSKKKRIFKFSNKKIKKWKRIIKSF